MTGLPPPGAAEPLVQPPDAVQLTADEEWLEESRAASRHSSLRRFLHEPFAVAALMFLAIVMLVAIFASVLAPYDPNAQDLLSINQGPTANHLLGTDDLGRDILSRLMYGARLALRAPFQIVGLALAIGVPLGLLAGFFRGWFEAIVMRFMDALFAFPPLVFILAIAATIGSGFNDVTIAVAIVFVPGLVRLVRGEVISVREETYIEAARSLGASSRRQILKHTLPNVASPLIVQVATGLGFALLLEAGLSFLGLAEQPPTPNWGTMFSEAYHFIYQDIWALIPPLLIIVLTVLAFNMVADGMRDSLGREKFGTLKTSANGLGAPIRWLGTRLRTARVPVPVHTTSSSVQTDETRLLTVSGLRVEFAGPSGWSPVVEDVGFGILPGQTLGLVGESGSGKTVSALSIMGLIPPREGRIAQGSIRFGGTELLGLSSDKMRELRGNDIAMIFQEPMTSLNPAFTVGNQIAEQIRAHQSVSRTAAWNTAVEMLAKVGIPDPQRRSKDFPHAFSGGMRQRVMIAMALTCQPKLLIADEPTTALDVTTQAQILDLLRDAMREYDMAMLFVTHDLGVIAEIADHVAVMYAGQIVEQANVNELFSQPHHPYTEALMASMPQLVAQGDQLRVISGQVPRPDKLPSGCRFHPRCSYANESCTTQPILLRPVGSGPSPEATAGDAISSLSRCIREGQLALSAPTPPGKVPQDDTSAQDKGEVIRPDDTLLEITGLTKTFPVRTGLLRRVTGSVRAVDSVQLTISAGQTLGLVGESGSGKSTLARLILRLIDSSGGNIRLGDTDVTAISGTALRKSRQSMQIVFQDPYSSLDPRMTVAEIVGEPLEIHQGVPKTQRDRRVAELLEQVGLGRHLINRHPHEFSGGQRQRIAIARALALRPRLVVCDEPVSALDVSTQSQVMNLLTDLQDQLGLTYLFIAHDLSVVRHISDRIAVMYLGRIVEEGTAEDVYLRPTHPYTEALLSAIPVPQKSRMHQQRITLRGDVANPLDPPPGCAFHPRCPHAMDICSTVAPEPFVTNTGATVTCHLHTYGPELNGRPVTDLLISHSDS